MKHNHMKNIYKKITLIPLIALTLAVGFSLPTKTQAQTPVSNCIAVYSDLFLGNYDINGSGEVTVLQTYLYQNGYMSHVPTGYYGGLTWAAVAKFQRANGISGTGYTGPLTRARLQQLTCGMPQNTLSISAAYPSQGIVGSPVTLNGTGFSSNSTVYFGGALVSSSMSYPISGLVGGNANLIFTVPQYITPCAPNANCIQLAQQVTPGTYPVYVRNYDGTVSNTINFIVTNTGTTQQFSIAGIDAPSTLTHNNTGTWTIRVNNAGGNLRYSVVWGDDPVYYTSGNQIVAPSQNYQSSATFTHSYNRTGTFNPVFTVTDDSGRTATISTSVMVTPVY